jgi:hypothetical protein
MANEAGIGATHGGVPGASGQPPEQFQELDFNSISATVGKPNTSYEQGNPLQETAETEVKVWPNTLGENPVGQTSNEINGGRDITNGPNGTS